MGWPPSPIPDPVPTGGCGLADYEDNFGLSLTPPRVAKGLATLHLSDPQDLPKPCLLICHVTIGPVTADNKTAEMNIALSHHKRHDGKGGDASILITMTWSIPTIHARSISV
jgi:hypothetical protein